jgi:hypothetical protein
MPCWLALTAVMAGDGAEAIHARHMQKADSEANSISDYSAAETEFAVVMRRMSSRSGFINANRPRC